MLAIHAPYLDFLLNENNRSHTFASKVLYKVFKFGINLELISIAAAMCMTCTKNSQTS